MQTPIEFIELCRMLVGIRKHKHRRSTRWPTPMHQEDFLYLQGWQRIGAGHFGEAWQHQDYPDLVLKLSGFAGFGQDCQYDTVDAPALDAWPVYARHCQAHPHEHLPEILHFEQPSQRIAWAIMPVYLSVDEAAEQQDWLWVREAILDGDTDADWLWPIIGMQESLRFTVDLHDANVMFKPDGTYVITDPFSFGRTQ